jgi:Zn-dependent protease
MNLFRIRGIKLEVHFSFFLLLAFVAQEGWQDDGWPGLLWGVGILVAFFTCVVLHELGHCFMAMRFGINIRRILLMPIGGMAEFDDIPRQPSRELLITFAGPAVNFAIAGILYAVVGLPHGWSLFRFSDYPGDLTGVTQLLLDWNLKMGCFNLVPVFPMDGGRIFRALLATRVPYLQATFWAASVGKVLATLGALVALFLFHTWLTAVLFAFIFFAGEMEYRAVKRREIEDAHWRAVLARAYAATVPPPAEEPPMLTG